MKPFLQYLRESETDHGRMGFTWDSNAYTHQAVGDVNDPRTLSEGTRVSGNVPGHGMIQRVHNQPISKQVYEAGLKEARALMNRAYKGDRWAFLRLQEALTTSDFGVYFGDVLDRSVLANYVETPYTWDQYCLRKTIADMRQAKIFRFDRGAAPLDGPIVPDANGASGSGSTGIEQVSEYPLRKRVASNYVDQLYKFGARVDFAMEVIMNDDLDALKDTPALLGRAARRTEESRVTKLYTGASGPNTTFFSDANKNLLNTTNLPNLTTEYGVNNNPRFSWNALAAAIALASQQKDLDGQPVSIQDFVLVYPPQIHAAVVSALGAKEVWLNVLGGTTTTFGTNGITSGGRVITGNFLADLVKPAMNYYLPIVDTTSGTKAWYLFANPKAGRPALQLSFLRSRPAPQIFMKLPNQVAIGEGMMGPGAGAMVGTANVNPMEGDFESDAIDYKIRHFLGGTLLDPIVAVCSTGADS